MLKLIPVPQAPGAVCIHLVARPVFQSAARRNLALTCLRDSSREIWRMIRRASFFGKIHVIARAENGQVIFIDGDG